MDVRYTGSVLSLKNASSRRKGYHGGSQLKSSHAVACPHNRPKHLVSLQIYEMEQVPGVVIPAGVITQKLFIQNATFALLHNIRDPYTSDAELVTLGVSENVLQRGS